MRSQHQVETHRFLPFPLLFLPDLHTPMRSQQQHSPALLRAQLFLKRHPRFHYALLLLSCPMLLVNPTVLLLPEEKLLLGLQEQQPQEQWLEQQQHLSKTSRISRPAIFSVPCPARSLPQLWSSFSPTVLRFRDLEILLSSPTALLRLLPLPRLSPKLQCPTSLVLLETRMPPPCLAVLPLPTPTLPTPVRWMLDLVLSTPLFTVFKWISLPPWVMSSVSVLVSLSVSSTNTTTDGHCVSVSTVLNKESAPVPVFPSVPSSPVLPQDPTELLLLPAAVSHPLKCKPDLLLLAARALTHSPPPSATNLLPAFLRMKCHPVLSLLTPALFLPL
jgi:hypothetical protein